MSSKKARQELPQGCGVESGSPCSGGHRRERGTTWAGAFAVTGEVGGRERLRGASLEFPKGGAVDVPA